MYIMSDNVKNGTPIVAQVYLGDVWINLMIPATWTSNYLLINISESRKNFERIKHSGTHCIKWKFEVTKSIF